MLRKVFRWIWILGAGGTLLTAAPGRAWYSSRSLACAGGGLFLSGEPDRLNPAALLSMRSGIHSSVLSYPAGIRAYSLIWTSPDAAGIQSLALRQLDYGQFTGRDAEGIVTDTYRASDTWIQVARAGHSASGRSAWGVAGGLWSSQIARDQQHAILTTASFMMRLDSGRVQVGLAYQNGGWDLTSKHWLEGRWEITYMRRLRYLPLQLYLDAQSDQSRVRLGLGGDFRLNANLHLLAGTSSQRLDQSIHRNSIGDFLADTGFGLFFQGKRVEITVGNYFYNPGAWARGVDVVWNLK